MREPTIIDINQIELKTHIALGRPGKFLAKYCPIETGVPGVRIDFTWGSLSKDYGTPRHRHTFDQIRYQLSGIRRSDDGNIFPGDCAYFPEGVYYGPQQQEEVETELTLQFSGPSCLPYYTHEELTAARKKLEADGGTFSGGIYTRAFPDGRKVNKDSHQACTELLYGAPVEFPEPRYTGPIIMKAENYRWIADQSLPGLDHKHLGTFGERRTSIRLMRLTSAARIPAHIQGAAEMMYVTEGTIEYGGRTWQGGKTEDCGTFIYCPHGSKVLDLTARADATFFVVSWPMVHEVEAERKRNEG